MVNVHMRTVHVVSRLFAYCLWLPRHTSWHMCNHALRGILIFFFDSMHVCKNYKCVMSEKESGSVCVCVSVFAYVYECMYARAFLRCTVYVYTHCVHVCTYIYIYVRETFMYYVTLLFLEGRVSKVSKSTG